MNRFIYFILIIVISSSLISCDKLKGKSTQKNYDSLFLGFSLGMEKKAFYDLCTSYNQKKLFTHGPTNQSVEYLLTNETKSKVIMRFYPSFENDKIYEMPVTFTYEAWAPWNRQFQSDSLLIDMVKVFKKWYGNEFQIVNHKTMGTIYAKMDGKRRINLFIKDDQFVQAVFTDLEVEDQKIEKAKAKPTE